MASAKTKYLRGTLTVLRRRCGTPSCHCVQGERHATPVLSYREDGSNRLITLKEKDLPGVRAALARYQKARARLEKEASAGVHALRRRRQAEIAKRRAKKK